MRPKLRNLNSTVNFQNLKRLNIYMSVNKPIYFKKAFTKMLLDKIQNLETAASTMYNVASTIDMV